MHKTPEFSGDELVSSSEMSQEQSLAALGGAPMELGHFLQLAVQSAAALAELHQRNIIHKNINPHHILIQPQAGAVTFANFSIASPRLLEGMLAYMSPEQTGRMNRTVDYRTDLYSLGITFYELLTGTLPFQADDPLEWVHCHIARLPRPPADITPAIPPMVSAIVLKLLAKTTEERYQTALGLKADLERCLVQWKAKQIIDPFPLGEGDISDRLLIPQKLYGREKDIETLLSAFDRVIERGTPELVMVAGYSGVGKSSLVRELYKSIVRERGFVISGKFDQYKRDIPYATMAEAFRELIQQLLTESEERIAAWRQRLQSALGLNGQLIVEVIPQVELIIGRQPPVPELPAAEAQNRFNMVFRQFIGVFTQQEHPLVVFLDDLQWVDSASLKLLEHVITYPDTRYLLLIGAYRDNEVSPSHPLLLTLNDIRHSRVIGPTITLSPLSFADLSRLMADTFRSTEEQVEPLTRLVYDKTAGNPFFAIQFLMTLYHEGLVELDPVARVWKWDMARIQAKGYTDNVVELMVGKLRKLSPETQQALRLAACIGNKFDLHTLAVVGDISDEETQEVLGEAWQEGLALRLTDTWGAFLHDRVQQAAYSLIPEEERAAVHLEIGRLLLKRTPAEAVEEQIFDLVNQFNLGAALLADLDEKYRLAELNLLAGRKAKASTAYTAALNYLSAGTALLTEASWAARYELTYSLYLQRAECEFLNGRFDEAERLTAELVEHAQTGVEKAAAYHVQINLFTTWGQSQRAIDSAIACLGLFDIELSHHPLPEQVVVEERKIWQQVGDRPVDSLIKLPVIGNPEVEAAISILAVILPTAYFTDLLLHRLVACHMVNLTLCHGVVPASSMGFASFGLELSCDQNRYQEAGQFGRLAYNLIDRHGFLTYKTKVGLLVGAGIQPWTRPLRTGLKYLRESFQAGIETGDILFAGFASNQIVVIRLLAGDPLEEVKHEVAAGISFSHKTRYELLTDITLTQQRFVCNLQGETADYSTFGGPDFDEPAFEKRLQEGALPVVSSYYYTYKLQAQFLYGDYETALASSWKAHELLFALRGQPLVAEFSFYQAMILAALYVQASPEKQNEYLGMLRSHQEQLTVWAENSPENFQGKYALVSAEIARITGQELEAERLYEQAIRSAHNNGFIQNEGISYELAARFYQQRGFEKIAATYLSEARACYLRWGADGKVRQLDQTYPLLRASEAQVAIARGIGAQVGQLDAITVVKASQAISSEIMLANLLETLLQIVLKNAGAQKGYLILARGEELTIEVEARVEGATIEVWQEASAELASVLPLSIVNYVRRTRDSVILDDASTQSMFSSDEYMVRSRPLSVLCLPILRQANLAGLLYLENNLARGAFPPDRIAVLELLAAQAAISLENARLYAALRESEARYRGLFEDSPISLWEQDFSAVKRLIEGLRGQGVTDFRAFFESHPEVVNTCVALIQITAMNNASLSLYGANNKAELLAGLSQLVPSEAYPIFLDNLVWIAEGQTAFSGEGLNSKLSGEPIDVRLRWSAAPGYEASLAKVLVSVEDITERKRAEKLLRASEERFSKAFQSSPSAMSISHLSDRRYIDVNDCWLRQRGCTRAEVIGHTSLELGLWANPADHAILISQLRQEGSVRDLEVNLRRKSGEVIVGLVSADVIELDGEPCVLAAVQDITEQKKLESQLRQAQKMEAIGRLAGGIAHDFNNLLTTILGYTQLLLDDLAPHDGHTHDLEAIHQAGERAANLTRQLLAFSRQQPLITRPLDLNLVVTDLRKLLHRLIGEDIELLTRLDPALGLVKADPGQIEQVLMNLVINARDAMPQGGKLIIETANFEVDADFARLYLSLHPGPYVLLTVSDTGHGMDMATLSHVFEPFFSTKEVGKGTGLGLATVYGIVQQSGGAVWAYSEVGYGATFKIYLPRLTEPFQPSPLPLQNPAMSGGSETILLVEDEAGVRELVAETLRRNGYTVLVAANGPEALRLGGQYQQRIHLLVTDVVMPGMSGRRLVEQMASQRPDMKVLFISGYTDDIILHHGILEGAGPALLQKPFPLDVLAQKVREILDNENGRF